jgi:hypothetical protein
MNHKISQITTEMLQNWNTIHNLDIGDFCKKNPETGPFLFFLAHILAHMVFAYLLPEAK